jgi:hypothetical protein
MEHQTEITAAVTIHAATLADEWGWMAGELSSTHAHARLSQPIKAGAAAAARTIHILVLFFHPRSFGGRQQRQG